MSKQSEMSLLVPGARGWELWKQGAEGAYVRQSESESADASALTGLPAGHLTMLFPVRSWNALPFRASSVDDSLFEDLSAMHAERLGVRWDPMAGQLSDTFLVAKEEENSILLTVVLKSPGEGDIPSRTPKEFDLSARGFPVEGDAVAVWMEFGRWVFSIYRGGRLLYAQATSSETSSPDDSLLREIRLALSQLAIQGLGIRPTAIHIWSADGTAGSLASALGIPARVSPRPDPLLPQPHSKLLPADVRAARRVARSRQQKVAAVALVVLAYLGAAGWFGYGIWKDQSQVRKLKAQASEIAPDEDTAAYAEHKELWRELDLVIDNNKAPVDVMFRITKAIPAVGGLRLKTAEINEGEVKLIGEAPQQAPIGQFSLNLGRESFGLSHYQWANPPATNSSKGWDFAFIGTVPK